MGVFLRRSLSSPALQQKKPATLVPEQYRRALAARKKIRTKKTRNPQKSGYASRVAHYKRIWLLRGAAYLMKMQGSAYERARFSVKDVAWSFCGALVGMLALAALNTLLWERTEQGLLIGSMGASAMLVFSAPGAPFAQPRNVVGGHIVSSLMGVLAFTLLPGLPWVASALAVALAVAAMQITATQHPPAAASALIAVIGNAEIKALGWLYAFYPVGISAVVLVAVGVLVNNISRRRVYPVYWW